MFSMTRQRFSVAGLIATLALVFAMGGGAWAAKKYLITSTSQIKPSVLKKLKGKTGPAGPVGTAGPAGSAGPVGPVGPAGANGKDGVSPTTTAFTGAKGGCTDGGVEVKSASPTTFVCNGEEGEPGPTEFEGPLPKGETLRGTWAVAVTAGGSAATGISFPFPLASEPTFRFVKEGQEGVEHATECPGTAEAPEATEGNLCIYVRIATGNLGTASTLPPLNNGAALFFAGGTADAVGVGSWAVTAG